MINHVHPRFLPDAGLARNPGEAKLALARVGLSVVLLRRHALRVRERLGIDDPVANRYPEVGL